LLLGYGSDRWWRVQVLLMFAATGVIVTLGAYHYLRAPVHLEISLVDASLSTADGPSFEIRTDLTFANTGNRQVSLSDVSLCLARHNPPRCYVIPGRLEGDPDGSDFRFVSGPRELRTLGFSSTYEAVSEGLDIGQTGRFLVEASLQVTVVDRLGRERRIPVVGMTVVVDDGVLREIVREDAAARYVGT
jgi:hypothetical protein